MVTEHVGPGLRFAFTTTAGERIVVEMKRTRRPYTDKNGVSYRGIPNLWPVKIIERSTS